MQIVLLICIYYVCKIVVFLTLAMYYGKGVHFQEPPFGYDKIQQKCDVFVCKLFFKKCTLQLRNLLSSFPCSNVFGVTPSKLTID